MADTNVRFGYADQQGDKSKNIEFMAVCSTVPRIGEVVDYNGEMFTVETLIHKVQAAHERPPQLLIPDVYVLLKRSAPDQVFPFYPTR